MPGTEDTGLNYLPENHLVCFLIALWSPPVFSSKCALPRDRIISSGAAPAVCVDTQGRRAFLQRSPQSPAAHTAWPPLLTDLIGSGLGFALSVHDGRSLRSLGCSILLLILKKGGGVSKVLDAAAK